MQNHVRALTFSQKFCNSAFSTVLSTHLCIYSCHLTQLLTLVSVWLWDTLFRMWVLNTRQFLKTPPFVVVQLFSCVQLAKSWNAVWTQNPRPPCPSLSPWACSNSCPLIQWCSPTISSSVILFSSSPQSFPASGSFLRSQLSASGGQSIGASASASVLSMDIQHWFSLVLTGLISLLSKGLSRVFFNTTG